MWDKPLFPFWSAVALALELPHGCRFCPFFFLFLIVESWTLTFMLFWVLLWPPVWALREMSRSCTPGKVHHCYKFSPCVDNGSDRGLLESQRLRNCFYLNYSSFQTDTCQLFCSCISLDHGMICCSLSMLHFVRQVLCKWFLDSTCLGSNLAWVWLVKFNSAF